MARKAGGGQVVILGVRRLDRRFRRLEPELRRVHAERAMAAGMGLVLRAARENAPVDTGELRDAIRLETRVEGPRVVAEVKVGAGDFAGDRFYAAFVEYGTSKMPARPFLRPAVEAEGPRARAVAKRLLKAALKLAARGG